MAVGSVDLTIGAGALTLLGTFAGMVRAHGVAERKIVEARMHSLARRPFATEGFFENLAASPKSTCRVRVRVAFATGGALPETALMHDLLGLVGASEVDRASRTIDFESGELDCSQNDGPDTNRALYLWQEQMIAEVVEPLHDAHPLERVTLSRS